MLPGDACNTPYMPTDYQDHSRDRASWWRRVVAWGLRKPETARELFWSGLLDVAIGVVTLAIILTMKKSGDGNEWTYIIPAGCFIVAAADWGRSWRKRRYESTYQ